MERLQFKTKGKVEVYLLKNSVSLAATWTPGHLPQGTRDTYGPRTKKDILATALEAVAQQIHACAT